MNAIQTLTDFLDRAKKERKYADNTVGGFKAALNLFQPSLNDSEKESLDVLLQNISTIADDVYAKNKDKYSSSTVMIYRRRITGLINDYKQYGGSPSKMASWNPRRLSSALKDRKPAKVQQHTKRTSVRPVTEAEIIDVSSTGALTTGNSSSVSSQGAVTAFDISGRFSELNRSEIYLRDGLKIMLELPTDLSEKEASKIKAYIDVMVND